MLGGGERWVEAARAKRPREAEDALPADEQEPHHLKMFAADMDKMVAKFVLEVDRAKEGARHGTLPVGESFDRWQRLGWLMETQTSLVQHTNNMMAQLIREAHADETD